MSVADFLERLPDKREIEIEPQRCQDRQAILRKLLKIAEEKEQSDSLLRRDQSGESP